MRINGDPMRSRSYSIITADNTQGKEQIVDSEKSLHYSTLTSILYYDAVILLFSPLRATRIQ